MTGYTLTMVKSLYTLLGALIITHCNEKMVEAALIKIVLSPNLYLLLTLKYFVKLE